jgi:hypothetical protein
MSALMERLALLFFPFSLITFPLLACSMYRP